MLKNVTNCIDSQVNVLSGTTIGGTDKELNKTSYQSRLNVFTDAN